jgi:hypothetical protein
MSPLSLKTDLLIQKSPDFLGEFTHFTELLINGGKADIGDLIKLLEALHHHVADLFCGNFPAHFIIKALFDITDNLFNAGIRYIPLLTGAKYALDNLLTVKLLPPAILLDDKKGDIFNLLTGCKSLVAIEAFPPAPDECAITTTARIHHLAVILSTKWTLHLHSPTLKVFEKINFTIKIFP